MSKHVGTGHVVQNERPPSARTANSLHVSGANRGAMIRELLAIFRTRSRD